MLLCHKISLNYFRIKAQKDEIKEITTVISTSLVGGTTKGGPHTPVLGVRGPVAGDPREARGTAAGGLVVD